MYTVLNPAGCAANADVFSVKGPNSSSAMLANSDMKLRGLVLFQAMSMIWSWQQQACSTNTPSLADKQQVSSLYVSRTEVTKNDWGLARPFDCSFYICLCTVSKHLCLPRCTPCTCKQVTACAQWSCLQVICKLCCNVAVA